MVLVYIKFLIDTGLGGEVHGAQGSGSEQSLREGPVVHIQWANITPSADGS